MDVTFGCGRVLWSGVVAELRDNVEIGVVFQTVRSEGRGNTNSMVR